MFKKTKKWVKKINITQKLYDFNWLIKKLKSFIWSYSFVVKWFQTWFLPKLFLSIIDEFSLKSYLVCKKQDEYLIFKNSEAITDLNLTFH